MCYFPTIELAGHTMKDIEELLQVADKATRVFTYYRPGSKNARDEMVGECSLALAEKMETLKTKDDPARYFWRVCIGCCKDIEAQFCTPLSGISRETLRRLKANGEDLPGRRQVNDGDAAYTPDDLLTELKEFATTPAHKQFIDLRLNGKTLGGIAETLGVTRERVTSTRDELYRLYMGA